MLNSIGLACDTFNSPSDYIIEIAAEDYGEEPIQRLQGQLEKLSVDDETFKALPLLRQVKEIRRTPFFKSMFILLRRALVIYFRNFSTVLIRILAVILITMGLSVMFGRDVGKFAGCPIRKLVLYSIPLEKISTLFEENLLMVTQNCCALFFGLMVGLISGMTGVVLEFPREMHIITKEYNNGWYSCLAIYVTKSLISIPMQIIIPSIYLLWIYWYTNQPEQYFREGYLLLISIMVSFISESIGEICSAIFMNKPTAASFIAGAVPLPMVLFGGFLVKYSRMPIYMRIFSWLSLLKYAFEALMVTMYGFDRCVFDYQTFLEHTNTSTIEKPVWAQYLPLMFQYMGQALPEMAANSTEDPDEFVLKQMYSMSSQQVSGSSREVSFDRSLILDYYELEGDALLYREIIYLAIYYVVVKVTTYFIIIARMNFKY